MNASVNIQDDAICWQVRIFYNRENKWSLWQDIKYRDLYESARDTGKYYEYDTIEVRELVVRPTKLNFPQHSIHEAIHAMERCKDMSGNIDWDAHIANLKVLLHPSVVITRIKE